MIEPALNSELDLYCERIGYCGKREPTLETLRSLQQLHPQAIPFENLDPLLGRPVSLDPAALVDKLLRRGRGGWCFEHNLLFARVLKGMGFHLQGLLARGLWNLPPNALMHRTHMLLRVELDNESWLADVGYGGHTLTGPIRLERDALGTVQVTPHEDFRVVRQEATDSELRLESLVEQVWRPAHRFDLQEQQAQDYEPPNHFLCTHPSSRFLRELIVSRTPARERYVLRGNVLSKHRLGQPTEQETLETPGALRSALEETFRISLPDDPMVDGLLKRFTEMVS